MKRHVIPMCSRHKRFQTTNGRWLNKDEDFNNHVIYTHSQDALIEESACDKCPVPNQMEIDFEEVRPVSDYKEAYDKILKSGMFWELHPELTGRWSLDKDEFINFHN